MATTPTVFDDVEQKQAAPQKKTVFDDLPSAASSPSSPGAAARFAGGVTEGSTGLPSDIRQWPKALSATFAPQSPTEAILGPISTAYKLGKGMFQAQSQASQEGLNRMKQPGLGNKAVGALHYLEGNVPFIGPSLVNAGNEAASGDYARAAGTTLGAAGAVVAPELAERAASALTRATEAATTTAPEIRAKAGPGLEAAGNEVRTSVSSALSGAEDRVKPLYENMHAADRAELEQSGKPGSVDVGSAADALRAARKRLYGDAPPPRAVGAEAEKLDSYMAGKTPMADMVTARALRSQLSDTINSAIARGDRPLASSLIEARNSVTDALKQRASDLGLSTDFNIADSQWRQIQKMRDTLEPLTKGEDSEALLKKVREGSPEVRNAVSRLGTEGLLDSDRVNELSNLQGTIGAAEQTRMMPWIKRAMLGYLPASAAVGVAKHFGVDVPGGFMLPYFGGMGGVTIADILRQRLGALGAIKQLPELESPEIGLGEETPTSATFPEPPVHAGPSAPAFTGGNPIFRMSEADQLRENVPLELRPQQGERPFEQSLTSILGEPSDTSGVEREAQLREELERSGSKARTKARTAEAVKQFKLGRKSKQ